MTPIRHTRREAAKLLALGTASVTLAACAEFRESPAQYAVTLDGSGSVRRNDFIEAVHGPGVTPQAIIQGGG